jgi:seryl-tRNA synthetase
MDKKIDELRENMPLLKTTLKTKSASLHVLKSAPTTDALRAFVAELERKKGEMEEKLQGFKSVGVEPVSVEERDRVKEEWRYWDKRARARKRAFENLEGVLLDEGMKKGEIWVSFSGLVVRS